MNIFCKTTFSFALQVVLCACFTGAYAQSKDKHFATEQESVQHKERFAQSYKKTGLNRPAASYYKYRVNATKVNELKAVGIDLKKIDKLVGEINDFKVQMLYADQIIKGTIVGKEYDSRENVAFHTTYKVRIDEFIDGSITSKFMNLKQFSGPSGKNFVRSSAEPEYFLGEEVILYLNNVDFEDVNETRASLGLGKEIQNASADDFTSLFKISIKNDYAFDAENHRIDKVDVVKSDIKKISKVLDKKSFYITSF